jgi:cytochrome P450
LHWLKLFDKSTLVTAGMDTAIILIFTLWELAKHPEDQKKIRAEVMALQKEVSKSFDFSTGDYERLEHLNLVIRVILT